MTEKNKSVFSRSFNRPNLLVDSWCVSLSDGAPEILSAGEPGSTEWEVLDTEGNFIPLVQYYDAPAGILEVLACDHKGNVAYDVQAQTVVRYRRAGGFKVRRRKGEECAPQPAPVDSEDEEQEDEEIFPEDPELSDLLRTASMIEAARTILNAELQKEAETRAAIENARQTLQARLLFEQHLMMSGQCLADNGYLTFHRPYIPRG